MGVSLMYISCVSLSDGDPTGGLLGI